MSILRQVRGSRFLRHNFIFFIGSISVGALNYLYYPVMGRLLPPAAFGEVQTLISLFLQVTIFLMVLGLVTINIVANYRSDTERDAVIREFEQLALVLSIVLLFFTIIFQDTLKHFLQFNASWPFILLMTALVATVPFTFRGAFLRGKQQFALASLANIISAAGKLAFAVVFVALGTGSSGAIGGLVAAQIVASGFAAFWARRHGLRASGRRGVLRLPDMHLLAPELKYGALVLIGSLTVTLQYSVDIVVVKHYFDPHTAGLYAGMASVARIIFFLTASVALVLMPMVRIDAEPGANKRLLLRSLILLAAAGLPVLAVFVLAPQQVVTLLMGREYAAVAELLPTLSVAIFTVSVLNLIVSYYLALRRYSLAVVIIIGAVVTYALLLTQHDTLRAVVNNVLIGSSVMLALLLIWVGISKTRS